jgi:hypothetical protein
MKEQVSYIEPIEFDPTFWTWNNVKQILLLSYALEADKSSHWKNTDQDHILKLIC